MGRKKGVWVWMMNHPADSANRGQRVNQDTTVYVMPTFNIDSDLRKALSDLDSMKASLNQERQAHQETKEILRQRNMKIQSLETELTQARANLKQAASPVKPPETIESQKSNLKVTTLAPVSRIGRLIHHQCQVSFQLIIPLSEAFALMSELDVPSDDGFHQHRFTLQLLSQLEISQLVQLLLLHLLL